MFNYFYISELLTIYYKNLKLKFAKSLVMGFWLTKQKNSPSLRGLKMSAILDFCTIFELFKLSSKLFILLLNISIQKFS